MQRSRAVDQSLVAACKLLLDAQVDAAVVAVNAAEAIYGRYKGSVKLKAALDSLKEKGFNVDSAQVTEAIQAAWKQLDQAMYASGEKYDDDESEE